MKITNSNDRMLRVLQASPEQLAAIDRVLEGRTAESEAESAKSKGPLLLRVCDAARYLGVHRATIHRLSKAGRLTLVPLLGAMRIRREELEAIAEGTRNAECGTRNMEPHGNAERGARSAEQGTQNGRVEQEVTEVTERGGKERLKAKG
jgi:excisionase family DNA binding protein